jgi:hypothetical protein
MINIRGDLRRKRMTNRSVLLGKLIYVRISGKVQGDEGEVWCKCWLGRRWN